MSDSTNCASTRTNRELRNSFQTFRIDRIKDCVTPNETFVEEPGRMLADYLRIVWAE